MCYKYMRLVRVQHVTIQEHNPSGHQYPSRRCNTFGASHFAKATTLHLGTLEACPGLVFDAATQQVYNVLVWGLKQVINTHTQDILRGYTWSGECLYCCSLPPPECLTRSYAYDSDTDNGLEACICA